MKIDSKYLIMFALIGAMFYFSSLTLSHSASIQTPAANSYWSNFLPDAVNDQGIDVRDAQNRKISSQPARSAFKDLFVFKVFQLMVNEDLPRLTQIRKMLSEMINPLAQKIREAARCLWSATEAVLAFGARQLESLVQIFKTASADQFVNDVTNFFNSQISFRPASRILPLRC